MPQFEKTEDVEHPLGVNPSRSELSILYLLLGTHLILGTNAVIHPGADPFIRSTLTTIGLLLLVRVLVAITRFRKERLSVLSWTEYSGILLVFAAIYTTNLGITARVYFSEKELMEIVDGVRDRESITQNHDYACGLLTVQSYSTARGLAWLNNDRHIVWFETCQGSPLFEPPYALSGGVVFCETGMPTSTGESHYSHLFGPWWLWLEDI